MKYFRHYKFLVENGTIIRIPKKLLDHLDLESTEQLDEYALISILGEHNWGMCGHTIQVVRDRAIEHYWFKKGFG